MRTDCPTDSCRRDLAGANRPFTAALVFLPVVMRVHLQHEHGEVIPPDRINDAPLSG